MLEEKLKDILSGKTQSVSSAKQTVDGILNDKVLLDAPHHSSFFYELRPIIKVARHVAAEKFCFSGHRSDCSYDGEIYLNGKKIRVECTRSDAGHHEALEREHRQKFGRAPALQKVEASGSKHKREIQEQQSEFIDRSEIFKRVEQELTDAFQKKMKDKYQGYWLIITFSDIINPKKEYDTSCILFWEKTKHCNSTFDRVFIIGNSMEYLWDSKQNNQDSDRTDC